MPITDQDVKNIIDTDVQVQPYIDYTTALMQVYFNDSNMQNAVLEQIQIWLTAHAIATTNGRLPLSLKAGSVSLQYANTFGKGLLSTPYGQQAITLDPTGTLEDKADMKNNIKFIGI